VPIPKSVPVSPHFSGVFVWRLERRRPPPPPSKKKEHQHVRNWNLVHKVNTGVGFVFTSGGRLAFVDEKFPYKMFCFDCDARLLWHQLRTTVVQQHNNKYVRVKKEKNNQR